MASFATSLKGPGIPAKVASTRTIPSPTRPFTIVARPPGRLWQLESVCRDGAAELSRRVTACSGAHLRGGHGGALSASMSLLDESCTDSFGNECLVQRSMQKELEGSAQYRKLVVDIHNVERQLAEAIKQEEYQEASEIRDVLQALTFQKRTLEVSARPRTLYRVGDVIIHKKYGYRGVIYGHDPRCGAPEEWQRQMGVDRLPNGREQPFYHVLVDGRDRPGGVSNYVAEDNVDLAYSPTRVQHPWVEKFFVDHCDGQYVPGPKLRRLYPHDW